MSEIVDPRKVVLFLQAVTLSSGFVDFVEKLLHLSVATAAPVRSNTCYYSSISNNKVAKYG